MSGRVAIGAIKPRLASCGRAASLRLPAGLGRHTAQTGKRRAARELKRVLMLHSFRARLPAVERICPAPSGPERAAVAVAAGPSGAHVAHGAVSMIRARKHRLSTIYGRFTLAVRPTSC